MYFDVELAARVGVGRGERPEVFQKAVCEHDILLICGVQNMLNMDVGQSTIAEVLVDESACEFDAMYHTSLLTENGIAKPFENMLVIFIRCDVVNADKDVKEIQVSE